MRDRWQSEKTEPKRWNGNVLQALKQFAGKNTKNTKNTKAVATDSNICLNLGKNVIFRVTARPL